MRISTCLALLAALLAVGFGATGVHADERPASRIQFGRFSTGVIPDGWEPLQFPGVSRLTDYTLVRKGDGWVVRARSDASASGLLYPIEVDPREYPILRWSWKVESVLEKGDFSSRDGDDSPARIYVAFEYEPAKRSLLDRLRFGAARLLYGEIPGSALNYVWGSREPRNKVYAGSSPFTDFSRLLVCRSEADPLDTWIEEERNLYEDYRLAFGAEPPAIIGIGIMSDTDNTGERATAYFGDLTLLRQPSGPRAD